MSRRPFDAYYTPAWPVRRFLERGPLPSWGNWIEPGAGSGNIIRAVDDFLDERSSMHIKWTAVEVRGECIGDLVAAGADHIIVSDFLEPEPIPGTVFDLSIGNPPYDEAMAFFQKSRAIALRVAFLLRLDFMATAKRCAVFRHDQPDIYVVPDRISFTDDGKTDQYDYGWFYWPEERRHEGKIVTLDATPLDERRGRKVAA